MEDTEYDWKGTSKREKKCPRCKKLHFDAVADNYFRLAYTGGEGTLYWYCNECRLLMGYVSEDSPDMTRGISKHEEGPQTRGMTQHEWREYRKDLRKFEIKMTKMKLKDKQIT